RMRADFPQTQPSYEAYQEAGRVGRRGSARAIAISALVLIAVAGAGTAPPPYPHKPPAPPPHPPSGGPPGRAPRPPPPPSTPARSPTILPPASASGFDALNPADTGNENSDQAANVLTGNSQGWDTQYYASAHFGNLKAGTGFILNLGAPAQVSSVTVQFGTIP